MINEQTQTNEAFEPSLVDGCVLPVLHDHLGHLSVHTLCPNTGFKHTPQNLLFNKIRNMAPLGKFASLSSTTPPL